jgi:hypothetical protein
MNDITFLLKALERGEPDAAGALLEHIYKRHVAGRPGRSHEQGDGQAFREFGGCRYQSVPGGV